MASTLTLCTDEHFGAVGIDGADGKRYIYPVCTCDMGEAEIATLIPRIEAQRADGAA